MPNNTTTLSTQTTTKAPSTQDTCVTSGGTQCPDKTTASTSRTAEPTNT